jgi:hypothetical protein
MFYEIQKYLIVLVALSLAIIELRLYSKYYKTPTKILFAIIGLYWGLYYIYSLIRPVINSSFVAHQIFVRPGILFTVSVLFANAVAKFRRLNHD